MQPKEISRVTGIDRDSIYDLLHKLKKRGLLERPPTRAENLSTGNSKNEESGYCLTKDSRWFVLARKLDLPFLELCFISYAYWYRDALRNSFPDISCPIKAFEYFQSIESEGHLERIATSLKHKGYFYTRRRKALGYVHARFIALDEHRSVLEEIIDWMNEMNKKKYFVMMKDPSIRDVLRMSGLFA